MQKHVQVLIDGKLIYDQQVDSGELCFNINHDERINLMAGPGTSAAWIANLWSGR